MTDLAKLCGWRTYHTHDSRRSNHGFPDIVMVHPKRGLVVFAELKREGGRTTGACHHCSGTGRVSDGRRERAEGYRVLAQLGLCACRTEDGWARPGYANQDVYGSDGRYRGVSAGRPVRRCLLPAVWLMAVSDPYGMKPNWVVRDTRREIDDAVALAWGTLPAETRAKILGAGQ